VPEDSPTADTVSEAPINATELDRKRLIVGAGAVVVLLLIAAVVIAKSRGTDAAVIAVAPTTKVSTPGYLLPLTGGPTGSTASSEVPPTTVTAETFPSPITSPPNTFPLPPTPYQVAVPKADGGFAIYAKPGDATPVRTMDNPKLLEAGNPATAVPLHFLLRGSAGNGWLEIFLPTRPNGSTGFVKENTVKLTPHNFRIEVRLSQFNLKAFDGSRLILDAPIAVATANTPTPGGLFFTTELIQPPPGSAYGTYAYGLSGHSEVYETFGGGDGQLGIHGTNDPSSIGRAASHGCIRLRNDDIDKLVPILPLGVPVQIYA